ncbi:hypothetical protein SK128_000136, partial [Halocaridina rubra]
GVWIFISNFSAAFYRSILLICILLTVIYKAQLKFSQELSLTTKVDSMKSGNTPTLPLQLSLHLCQSKR